MDQLYKDDGRPNNRHRFPVTDSLEFCHLVFANRLQNSPLSLSLPHKLVIQLFFLNPEIDLTDVEKKDGKGSNLSLVGHRQKMVRKELLSIRQCYKFLSGNLELKTNLEITYTLCLK